MENTVTLEVENKADHDVIVSNKHLFPAGSTVTMKVRDDFLTQILANRDLLVTELEGERAIQPE